MANDPVQGDIVSDRVGSGLRTTAMPDTGPPRLRVDWIDWDSGFRGSGLAVGDEIVAVAGKDLPADPDQIARTRLPGQPDEATAWTGAPEGTALTLTVRRRRAPQGDRPGIGHDRLEFTGRLLAPRAYRTADGRQTLGAGGPPRLANDGFQNAWAGWYERRVFVWERQLCGGVWQASADSRMALAEHLEDEPRIRFLEQTYPGAFADAVTADWEAVRVLLAGRSYAVTPEDYAYRLDEERLLRDIGAAALQGWEAFLAARSAEIADLRTGGTWLGEALKQVAGRLVVLPPVPPARWITDVGHPFAVWVENGTVIVTAIESPALEPMWHAQIRFRRSVSPALGDELSIVGRILPEPRLIVREGQAAVVALEVTPVAALMGSGEARMFVDLTGPAGNATAFAGEDRVTVLPSDPPPPDAGPQDVMQALIAALYARDDRTWFSLFADWQVLMEDGQAWLMPHKPYPEANRDADWVRSRRVVLDRTVALRPVWVSDPVTLRTDYLEVPVRIEKVDLELDHVGAFGDEFRAFNSSEVRRRWVLARQDGGAWRILTQQGI